MSKDELNYMVTKKEFLVIVLSSNEFINYTTGYQVFMHTDHAIIKYLMNKLDVNAHIIR